MVIVYSYVKLPEGKFESSSASGASAALLNVTAAGGRNLSHLRNILDPKYLGK